MRRRRLPAGASVTSLTRLSLRTLRARPLRSLLTAGAIVLGVGMVFGVLLLVGTIHSTFDRLYEGANLAAVKKRYDPEERLTSLYDKAVRQR